MVWQITKKVFKKTQQILEISFYDCDAYRLTFMLREIKGGWVNIAQIDSQGTKCAHLQNPSYPLFVSVMMVG